MPGRRQRGQRAQRLGMEAGARRIGDHHLGPHAVAHQRRAARGGPRRRGTCSCRCRWPARSGRRRPPRPPPPRCRTRARAPARQQQADGAGARVEVDARVSLPSSAHASATSANSRSACTVLVWKNELAETWNVHAAQRLRDVIATEQQVLLAADRHAGLLGVDVEHDAGGRRHARAQRLGHRHQRLHVGRGGHDVDHGLAGAPPLAQRSTKRSSPRSVCWS